MPFYAEGRRAPTLEERKRGTEFPVCQGLEVLVAERVDERAARRGDGDASEDDATDADGCESASARGRSGRRANASSARARRWSGSTGARGKFQPTCGDTRSSSATARTRSSSPAVGGREPWVERATRAFFVITMYHRIVATARDVRVAASVDVVDAAHRDSRDMFRAPPEGLRARANALDDRRALRLHDDERCVLSCDAAMTIGDDDPASSAIPGELYITDARVAFVPRDPTSTSAYACEYRCLALHAISREDDRYGSGGCVYCQIDGGADAPSAPTTTNDDDANDDEPYDEDDPVTAHVRFVPKDATTLEEIYRAMSEGSLLNPDPDAERFDDDDDDDEFLEDDDEAHAREAALERLDKLLVVDDEVEALMKRDPGRFED